MNDDTKQGRNLNFYFLPSLFTITALFFGFYAVVAAMKGLFITAAIAIFIAMIFDGLDGRIARLTNTSTSFGAELDSLSDMVCFGITPPLAMYAWGLHSLHKLGWLIAFFYTVAVALRLARFNSQPDDADKRYFQGISCTAAAGIMASILWICGKYALNQPYVIVIVAITTLIVALLMVSNIPYRSYKDINLNGKAPFFAIVIFALLLGLLAISPAEVLLVSFFLYGLSGPTVILIKLLRKK